jgi:alpha-L-fucosidase 2
MLLQSHGTVDGVPILDVLPCLPGDWPDGALRGARARGALTIDLTWRQGKITSLVITSRFDQQILIKLPGREPESIRLAAGEPWSLPS